MNQFIANDIYDSEDLIDKLIKISNGKIKRIEDLTNATGRDDSFSFKFFIKNDTPTPDELSDKDYEKFLEKNQSFISDLVEKLKIDYTINKTFAIKYDIEEDSIIVISLIMYIESGRKKIDKLLNKLIKNNL